MSIKPIEGSISYDFREAINALARSTADAAMLASRWYDICDTTTAKDVEITLSSGESKKVPNLAKAIAALRTRSGEVDASSVTVHTSGGGVDIRPSAVTVGATGAKWADGTSRTQHSHLTPFNTVYDCSYLVSHASTLAFLAIPRYIFFNSQSTLDSSGAYTLTLQPAKSTAGVLAYRSDSPIALATKFTVINGDPNRTLKLNIVAASTTSYTLQPGEYKDFFTWCYADATVCNILEA